MSDLPPGFELLDDNQARLLFNMQKPSSGYADPVMQSRAQWEPDTIPAGDRMQSVPSLALPPGFSLVGDSPALPPGFSLVPDEAPNDMDREMNRARVLQAQPSPRAAFDADAARTQEANKELMAGGGQMLRHVPAALMGGLGYLGSMAAGSTQAEAKSDMDYVTQRIADATDQTLRQLGLMKYIDKAKEERGAAAVEQGMKQIIDTAGKAYAAANRVGGADSERQQDFADTTGRVLAEVAMNFLPVGPAKALIKGKPVNQSLAAVEAAKKSQGKNANAVGEAVDALLTEPKAPEVPGLPELKPEFQQELSQLPPGYPEVQASPELPRIDPMGVPELPALDPQSRSVGDAKVSSLPKPVKGALEAAEAAAKGREADQAGVVSDRIAEGLVEASNRLPEPVSEAPLQNARVPQPEAPVETPVANREQRRAFAGYDQLPEIDLAEALTQQMVPADVQLQYRRRFRSQAGAIGDNIFKEGFKRYNRALSNLTDRLAESGRFPASEYMTNPDSTPMIVLHFTKRNIKGELKGSDQGFHAGYATAAHLAGMPSDAAKKPMDYARRARRLAEKEGVDDYRDPYQGHPMAIKRGNYPVVDVDVGRWSPDNLLLSKHGFDGKSFPEYLLDQAQRNGTPLTPGRLEAHTKQILDITKNYVETHGAAAYKVNALFTQLLKEAGIDGFFYKNTGESLKNSFDYVKREVRADKKKLEETPDHLLQETIVRKNSTATDTVSFVTWDNNNFESIYKNPFVPKKQRGAWTPFSSSKKTPPAIDASDAAKPFPFEQAARAVKGSTAEIAGPEARLNLMSKVPGMATALEGYIAKDVTPAKALADLKALPDIEGPWWLIGGKEMVAQIKDNPALYAVGQWFNNARNRSELWTKEQVNPALKSVNRLLQKGEGEALLTILKKESLAEKRLTPEQLDSLGLSKTQREAYDTLRKAFDDALDYMNEKRLAIGLDPVKPREGYLASTWGGDWSTPIYDKTGKIVWYVAENSKSKALAAVEYLKKAYPDLDYKRSRVEFDKTNFKKEGSSFFATYKDVADILGKDDPVTQRLKEIYEAKVADEGYGAFGQSKHFLEKSNVRGFIGDRPWMDSAVEARKAFKSQINYLNNAYKWADMQTAVENAKKILADPELQVSHPNTLEWVREMSRNEMGFGTSKMWSGIEQGVGKAFGETANALSKIFPPIKNLPTDMSGLNMGLGISKSIFYIKNLGLGNIPFVVMSVIQPVFSLSHHTRLVVEGNKYNPFLNTFNSMHATSAHIIEHYNKNLSDKPVGVWKTLDPFFERASKYIEANKVAEMSQFSEVRDLGRPEALHKAETLGTLTITEPEMWARTKTFMEFADHLKQSGWKDEMNIFQEADRLTKLTMANYNHADRAAVFNRMGLAGNALSALKTFPINQFNQLYAFFKYGQKHGDVSHYAPLAVMIATQLTLAGTMGFFGMESVDRLWELMKQGYLLAGGENKKVAEFSPKKYMLENLPDWAAFGGVSKLSGVNFSSRMDAGTIIDPTFAGMVPFGADLGNIGLKALQYAANPTSADKRDQLAYAAVPSSLRGFAEMNLPTISNEAGDFFRPTKPGSPPIGLRPDGSRETRTEFEKATRGFPFWGMPSMRESFIKEQDWRQDSVERNIAKAKANMITNFSEAVKDGSPEEVRDAVIAYVEQYGDPRPLFRDMKVEMMNKFATKGQQLQLRAKTQQSQERLLRYQRAMSNVPAAN